jgi:hypothetical protein
LLAQERQQLPRNELDFISPFRTVRKESVKGTGAEMEKEVVRPIVKKAPPDLPLPFSEMLRLIGQVTPSLSDEEKQAIINRQLTPESELRMVEGGKDAVPEPLDGVVVTSP